MHSLSDDGSSYNFSTTSPADAAVRWLDWGLKPIPMTKGKTAKEWNSWLADLTPATLRAAWDLQPDYQVGAVIDDTIVVLIARSPEALSALHTIERALGKVPNQIHTAPDGEHHFFRRNRWTRAVMESHSPIAHPHRIDIRTGRGATEGRSLVVLPPSEGHSVKLGEARCVGDMTEADQAFIDAIALNNGSSKPRARLLRPVRNEHWDELMEPLQALFGLGERAAPVLTYGALPQFHAASGGSARALRMAQWWLAKNDPEYPGDEAVEYMWRAFA